VKGSDAYIVSAVRTPLGRRNGALSEWHPADLGAHVLVAALERAGVNPGAVDDVIFGCVDQVGAQAGNLARTAWLSAGLPEHVPATTVDRQCGSSQQAVHVAAQGIMAGSYELAVAGGVEVMSLVPLLAATDARLGLGVPLGGRGWAERYGDDEVSQFRGAELLVEQFGIGRERMDAFALESHRRAAAAQADGRLAEEIVAVEGFAADEGIRADASFEQIAALGPVFPGGTITAAQCSQISDGAAALVLASEEAVVRYRLTPLARVVSLGLGAADPITMLTGPIPATEAALTRAGMAVSEIDRFEVNEAFAPVVLAWADAVGADLARTNVRGGAIALGHPLGATGARIMTSLVHELRASGARYGLQTICEWGGTANATVLERV
jgi:acetyl-CoA C-acetyltransferase